MRERLKLSDVEVVEIPWAEPVVSHDFPVIPAETYAKRVESLRARMEEHGLSHVVVYGDREHFANTRWLTGYDPRFEESLTIVGLSGKPRLLVGLEGRYYAAIAQGVEVELYDEFSLQGQPQHGRTLAEILADCGLTKGSKVGLAGTKYRQTPAFAEAKLASDVPYYLVEVLAGAVGRENISDVTHWFTHTTTGLRIPLTVDEIALHEMINELIYAGMRDAMSALQPGVSEAEIGGKLGYDGSVPLSCHIVVSFGDNVNLALNSPTNRKLQLGDPLSVAIGVWGANIARTGIAVHDEKELAPEIADSMEKVFVPYFDMLLRWYGALHAGAVRMSMRRCGSTWKSPFQIALRAPDPLRWINAPLFGSEDVRERTMIQCDIIVPSTPPYPGVHTEDSLKWPMLLAPGAGGEIPGGLGRIKGGGPDGGFRLRAA